MGDGPVYTFYRPFHLGPLETVQSVARAVLLHDAAAAPLGAPVTEVVATGQARPQGRRDARRHRRVHGLRDARELGHGATRAAAADRPDRWGDDDPRGRHRCRADLRRRQPPAGPASPATLDRAGDRFGLAVPAASAPSRLTRATTRRRAPARSEPDGLRGLGPPGRSRSTAGFGRCRPVSDMNTSTRSGPAAGGPVDHQPPIVPEASMPDQVATRGRSWPDRDGPVRACAGVHRRPACL